MLKEVTAVISSGNLLQFDKTTKLQISRWRQLAWHPKKFDDHRLIHEIVEEQILATVS
jgi:hypothetical protein